MVSRFILRWAVLAPTLVFAIAAAWEFGLEDAVLRGLGYGPESSFEHWRYVLVATAAAEVGREHEAGIDQERPPAIPM